jgi:hypothetical protein
MIRVAKPGLREDLYEYIAQKEVFSIACYMCVMRTLYERPSIFVRDKPILSSETMLYKGYDHKVSVKSLWLLSSRGLSLRQTDWQQTTSHKVTLSQLRVALAEAGDSSGTQSKGNIRRWKELPSNG